jgi:hypothetical protein
MPHKSMRNLRDTLDDRVNQPFNNRYILDEKNRSCDGQKFFRVYFIGVLSEYDGDNIYVLSRICVVFL